MSFKITRKSAPSHTNTYGAKNEISTGAMSPRDRAVAKLQALAQPQTQAPVGSKAVNPNMDAPVASPAPSAETVEVAADAAAPVGLDHNSEATPTPESVTAAAPETTPVSADATPPSTEVKEEEAPLSDKYIHLARKEKALRQKAIQQEQALKQREEAFKQREAELAAREAEYKSKYIPKDALLEDPLMTLSELGLPYEKLTERALNAPTEQERQLELYKRQVAQEIKAMKDAQEKMRNEALEQQKQAYNQALNQIRSDVRDLVSSQADEFEAIQSAGLHDDVVDLIEKTFKQDGVLLSVEEAARAVEEHAVEEAFKYTTLKKIQQRLQKTSSSQTSAPKVSETKSGEQSAAPAPKPAQTLTNTLSSQRKLTARERAILAFNGERKT